MEETMEQEIEQEEKQIKKVNEKVNKLTEFLVDVGLDYKLETWQSGEGRDIVLKGESEDLKEYKISFAFKNNGYVSVDVETKEEPKGVDEYEKENR
jgi:hypothetical protein